MTCYVDVVGVARPITSLPVSRSIYFRTGLGNEMVQHCDRRYLLKHFMTSRMLNDSMGLICWAHLFPYKKKSIFVVKFHGVACKSHLVPR